MRIDVAMSDVVPTLGSYTRKALASIVNQRFLTKPGCSRIIISASCFQAFRPCFVSIQGWENQSIQEAGKENPMAVRIFVKRQVSDERIDALRELIDKLRGMTTGQAGYISGETMRRIDQPGEIMVISKWKTRQDWQRWFESAERTRVQRQIDELLGVPTTYEMYDFD
jgi:heme-degrading monooxygenase HmoA